MTAFLNAASDHWHHLAPWVHKPGNEVEYDALVEQVDELLATIGEDFHHPLASLLDVMSSLIEAYDLEHRKMPTVEGVEVLRYLMQEHKLKQSDLPEIGAQSVVSEVLSGKRKLNLRQIQLLAGRFKVPIEAFLP